MGKFDPANIGHRDLQETVLRDQLELLIEQPELERAVLNALHFGFRPGRGPSVVGRNGIGGGGIGAAGRTDDERCGQGDRNDQGDRTGDGHENALRD